MNEYEAAVGLSIGSTYVKCPACHDLIPIPVFANMTEDDLGRQYLDCKPDMTDLWAHSFIHEREEERRGEL